MVQIKNEYIDTESESKYGEYFDSFPYELSHFQKNAIKAIVDGNHVLVTAHTGSGKTLPAEFAINFFAGGESPRKKVIYTAPIKALSNQKFYEFTRKFPNISFGIITGDIKFNPTADVLIMTTEILCNNLMCGNGGDNSSSATFSIDYNTELAAVIFDEVHYINDESRGKVWEQTILSLPARVQLVMLSATIDAPENFARWVENRYGPALGEVVLCSTNKRVVPLTHYGFLTTTEHFYKTVCKGNKELEKTVRSNTNKFVVLKPSEEGARVQETNYYQIHQLKKQLQNTKIPRQHVLNELSRKLRDEEMLPAIAFVFSRKMVERFAAEVTTNLLEDDSKIPYIVSRECEQILRSKITNYREYLQLPEYTNLVSLLEKGIGIHHSGMLPILREIVELMISKKYIKLLFATESFAIGLDCPIKTAVFTSLTKYDGKTPRYLMPHEYSQMSGRAGRRGMDTLGHVIHCNNLFELPTLEEYKEILCGKQQKLVSKFYVDYGLILRLYKEKQAAEFGAGADFETDTMYLMIFLEKSMMNTELNYAIDSVTREINNLKAAAEEKRIFIDAFHKTPIETCRKYIEAQKELKDARNKKRKELERTIDSLKTEYRNIHFESVKVELYLNLEESIMRENARLDYLTGFFYSKIYSINTILKEYFLLRNGGDGYNMSLSAAGEFAARIGELHPVIFTHLLQKWDWFSAFSTEDIIGLFSCFADISIADEDKRVNPPEEISQPLRKCCIEFRDLHEHFYHTETSMDINSGFPYLSAMQFDLIHIAIQWARDCNTEEECKAFLQNTASKITTIGDFTKAMLKISNIAREIRVICEDPSTTFRVEKNMQQMDLILKLSQIDDKILKYIVTLQSLYI